MTDIKHETLTLNGVEYVRKDLIPEAPAPRSDYVLVRTDTAGVHVGVIKELTDYTLVLTDCRRIWRWRGKDINTLNELANHGCDETWSRISEPVPQNTIQWSEIIPVSKKALSNLTKSRWPA